MAWSGRAMRSEEGKSLSSREKVVKEKGTGTECEYE
jgi:hypothetical protein